MPKGAALITGASSGIGAELARLCAADGYRPILVARRASRLEQLAKTFSSPPGAARILTADLADPAAPQSIFDQTRGEPIEILINNAGFGVRGPYASSDWEKEARLIQVNMTALAHLTRLLLPGMLEQRSGRILNVASTAAFVPGAFMSMYYASKAFVLSFSHALSEEVRGSGVTVTVLCPGPTSTEFGDVAGMAGTQLFKGPQMSASEVARTGYAAMLAGKPEVIAGARNRAVAFGTRLAPRTLLARITRRLNT